MKSSMWCARTRRVWTALVAVACYGVFVGPPASAQDATVHLQGTYVHDAALIYSIGARYTSLRSEPELPPMGGTSVEAVSEWLWTAMLGAGWSQGVGSRTEDDPTLVGQLGLMYRTGAPIDRVGVVLFGNLKPGVLGPAVRARAFVVDVMAGPAWVRGDSGLTWFAGVSVARAFIGDLGR